jgi:hypothetical protein
MAQKTIFGWIISDPAGIAPYDTDKAHVSLCTVECDTDVLLRKFWEDEEIPQKLSLRRKTSNPRDISSLLTPVRRRIDTNTVRLPFKAGPPIDIGDSLQIATALHTRMEDRLQSHPEISRQYHEFLCEYLELGHMESMTESATTPFKPVYIPHHAVNQAATPNYESCSTLRARLATVHH